MSSDGVSGGRRLYEVSRRALLIIAGAVWMCAGFNVARLGVISYGEVNAQWFYYLLSGVVFLAFGAMFFRLTTKNIRRIGAYDRDRIAFWHFFNLRSYIIMVIMMGGGIGLRAAGVFPVAFVAVFYTGLGCALFLAGVLYFVHLLKASSANTNAHSAEQGGTL